MVSARKSSSTHQHFASPSCPSPGAAGEENSTPLGAAPALSAAPDGLSARRVETWLGLPAGAWQRRRLYALRVKVPAFSGLGIESGDLVVVDPGGKEQAGSVVVTRGTGGASLRRVPSLAVREPRLPTVLELPLRERTADSRSHVVGTVIGVLRPTGSGALRPVTMVARGRRRRAAASTVARELPTTEPRRSMPPELLERTRRKWTEWLRRAHANGALAEADEERCARLDASFTALCDCLSRTHNPEIRAALGDEARTLLEKIRNEMASDGRGYGNYPFSQ